LNSLRTLPVWAALLVLLQALAVLVLLPSRPHAARVPSASGSCAASPGPMELRVGDPPRRRVDYLREEPVVPALNSVIGLQRISFVATKPSEV